MKRLLVLRPTNTITSSPALDAAGFVAPSTPSPRQIRHRTYGTMYLVSVLLVTAFLFAGCEQPTKKDILDKAREVHTRGELEEVLGQPDKFEKLAMFEQWTYEASDGAVMFHVAGDKVVFRDTLRSEKKKTSE